MYKVRLLMALPMDGGITPYDEAAGRDTTVEGYKITCMDFIKDISKDYLAWVDCFHYLVSVHMAAFLRHSVDPRIQPRFVV